MDDDVLGWVFAVLKENLADEIEFIAERLPAIHTQNEKLQRRLDTICKEKLDSKIDQGLYDWKSSPWKKMLKLKDSCRSWHSPST